jgi:hypothetical protein
MQGSLQLSGLERSIAGEAWAISSEMVSLDAGLLGPSDRWWVIRRRASLLSGALRESATGVRGRAFALALFTLGFDQLYREFRHRLDPIEAGVAVLESMKGKRFAAAVGPALRRAIARSAAPRGSKDIISARRPATHVSEEER